MSAPRLAVLILGLAPFATPAWAADITPDQAASLQRQVGQWVADMFGPTLAAPDQRVLITPAGDHYAIAVPIKTAGTTFQITASARPLDGGKWAIDDLHYPSPLQFTLSMPETKTPDGKPNPMSGPLTYNITFAQQSWQALYDPSFATASTLNASIQDMNMDAVGQHGHITSHIDHNVSNSILRPAANGRVDLLSDGSLDGYTITVKTGDNMAAKIGITSGRVTAQVNNLSRERGVQLLHAMAQLAAQVAPPNGTDVKAPLAKLDPKVIKDMFDAITDFASGLTLDEKLSKLTVDYGDAGATLDSAGFSVAAKTDQGALNAHMDMGMAGLSLHGLPIGDMNALIPTRVDLQPAVSGLPVEAVNRLLKSSGDGNTPSDADVNGLFSRGGISAGLDSFAIDVGGASFTGMGKLLFTSPSAFTGTAQITATNLDLLQQRVAGIPTLAQALPVFIFAKGVGRTVQNQIVWDISYANGQLLINNQDMTAMMGGGAKSPAAPDRPRPGQAKPGLPPKAR